MALDGGVLPERARVVMLLVNGTAKGTQICDDVGKLGIAILVGGV